MEYGETRLVTTLYPPHQVGRRTTCSRRAAHGLSDMGWHGLNVMRCDIEALLAK
jgi:hypothetical protein